VTEKARTLAITPDSELALYIKHALAAGTPIVVDTGETVYQLEVHPGTPAVKSSAPSSEAEAQSPQDFYAEAIGRPDVAEILRRLAR
jgi:hypothetical protein